MVRITSGILASCFSLTIGIASGQDVPQILNILRDKTNGQNWNDNSGWFRQNSNDFCLNMVGVQCYDVDEGDELYGHIETLDLSENKLVGVLPSEVFAIPYLSQLVLRDNPDLTISFEGIEKGTSLKHLVLSRTHIEDFEGIENANEIQTLRSIHITGCGYEGIFPVGLTTLSQLKSFYANYNNFRGPIPEEISDMISLRHLYLFDNGITGPLPAEIGYLLELEILILSNNQITGGLPRSLNDLSKLRVLSLADNQLKGSLIAFDNLSEISEMYLENNDLEGSIPPDFLFDGPKHNEITIDLSNNQLSGTFTGLRLKEFDYLAIYLTGNKFEEIDDVLCQKDGWMRSYVDTYGCRAIMCPVGYYAPLGRQTSDDDICRKCESDDLGVKYMGARDCGNEQKTILKGLYDAMGGDTWEIPDEDDHQGPINWLDEPNECFWKGVICNDEGDVTDISLAGWGLTGIPPVQIFALPQLSVLNLSENFIKFQFDGINKAEKLRDLNLYSTSLSSLENIEQLEATSIRRLILSSNSIRGTIPDAIWELKYLRELAISHNKFRGVLSNGIGNLPNLKIFHAYGNKLTGEIPRAIGNLQNTLEDLVLSENDFVGEIPEEFNEMHVLTSLSMHQTNNKSGGISGTLPSFKNCYALTTLHLSGNSLAGVLPENFLDNSDNLEETIEVDLSSNFLEGPIPKLWKKFSFLNVDLSNNRINHIPGALCDKDGWQSEFLGESSNDCNYILCDVYSYNSLGRATSTTPCLHCESAEYFGATLCKNEDTQTLSILESLYADTNGGNWKNSQGWFTSNNVCDGWHGIYCDDDGIDIVKIDLSDNGVTGIPSTKVFNLPKLQELSLADNKIDFSFDGIDAASKLETLYLSNTRVSSLDGISKAISLKRLHLTECYLSGPLPSGLFKLVNLEALFMNYNQFSGYIPPAISQLKKLKRLYLMSNQLSGPIPAAIGELSELQILSLTDNTFSGSLPNELNNLKNIEVLAIQHERGNMSTLSKRRRTQQGFGLTGKLPSFDDLENIKELLLGYNSLTGTIPYNFLAGIKDKSQNLRIDLRFNMLDGIVPSSLTQFSEVETSLEGNKFSTIAPGLCKMTKWNNGDVKNNKCDAILCPKNTYSTIGRQSFQEECINCPDFTATLYLGAVECTSDGDQDELNEKKILLQLYDTLQGTAGWYSQEHWYDEDVSFCEWYGIACTPGETDSVEAIRLPSNGLSGNVSNVIFDLPNLKELDLSGNAISIKFDGIERATKLKSLNIGSTDLQDLTGINASPSLKILHAASNKLTGFPFEVLELSNLEVLYLSHNKFNTDLPDMSGLTQLLYFECKECALTGAIPDWLGALKKLQYLSLSGNLLTGGIPSTLSELPLLEYLDLSEQTPRGGGLTGKLPSFSSLEKLSDLYLHRNRLSGEISPLFLQSVNIFSVTIDLRYNELTGTIPDSFLDRFDDFTLLLAENKISSISAVCESDSFEREWNKGEVRKFGCDAIMCKPGFYSSVGRKTLDARSECKECDSSDTNDFYGSTTCGIIPDKVVLEALYNSLGGPDWINNELWMEDDLICEWNGVVCDSDGQRVIEINLEKNGLIGTVPSEIYDLTELRSINLKKNKVSLSFSGINQLTNLKSLNLSGTGLDSIEGLKNASSLRVLHLTGNMISAIPEDIYDLVNLKELYMNYNEMVGSISSKIGQLTGLEELYMFHNKLTGSLPAEIGQLKELRTLGLGENSFSGALPPQLNELSNIRVISLQHSLVSNQSGPGGPLTLKKDDVVGLTGSLPPFNNSPKLREVYLGYNDIGGYIPNDFLNRVENNDIIVDLTMNHISGSLPSSLQRLNYMTIYLAGNEIDSLGDSFCTLGTWMNGEVMRNGCDAILCPTGTSNEYGRQTTVGPSCEPCPFTFSAPYYGSGECLADNKDYDEKEILVKLFDATGGTEWLDSDNWKKDNVSICDWYGVHCQSEEVNGGGEVVKEISLGSNNLSGTIPPQVFDLKYLDVLNIRDNKIDIQLTGLMNEVHHLKSLYVSNTLISNLSGIGKLKNLRTLQLQQNNFLGKPIPDEVFTLTKLKRLYISDSNIGGELSSSIGNLSALEELYSHNNEITGVIPSEISLLSNLKALVLSENRFVGPLPDMTKMKSLQSLMIDSFTRRSAGLSGPFPSFDDLPNLRQIYLNDNSLTGSISRDFLGGVTDTHEKIKVGLKGNRIEGHLPKALKKFQKLDIDLADNLITSVNPDLCQNNYWMSGFVGKYYCDAILCPAGYYNHFGRQSDPMLPCKKCLGDDQALYLGATKCQAEIKKRERVILEMLYNDCGGANWKNKQNWLNNDVDICNWYGIQCNDAGSIDSILLGSNNLIGETPRELFELKHLKWLWLYSNPIDFSFHGIGQASSLTSLLLDSTRLTSLDGIGQAYQLVDLEVRFNRLSGPIPDELSHLANLEILTMSDNDLTGAIPSFNRMHRLKNLRIGNNHLTGDLPSFASNNKLHSIDLSGNKISGTIPSNFLTLLSTDETVYIDLSDNRIEGEVPLDLERFDKMTFYLKDNLITGVHTALCDQNSWNDGDVEAFQCDAILCPPGTYAPVRGRESKSTQCLECEKAKYYGQSECIALKSSASLHRNLLRAFAVTLTISVGMFF